MTTNVNAQAPKPRLSPGRISPSAHHPRHPGESRGPSQTAPQAAAVDALAAAVMDAGFRRHDDWVIWRSKVPSVEACASLNPLLITHGMRPGNRVAT